MIGRALERQVQGDIDAQLLGLPNEPLQIVCRPEVPMHGIMPAFR
jgi:hypothetical protein